MNAGANWVFIPLSNGLFMSKHAIRSILDQDIGNVQLLLADDGTTDGTLQWSQAIRYSHTNIQTIGSNIVMGPTYWWNRALEWLFDHEHAPYVLIPNNDVWLSPVTYRLLVEDGGLFVTGVSVSDMQATKTQNPLSRSPHPSFSCFLIRQEVWRKVGSFNRDLVIYCQDADYHLRMDKAGVDAYAIAVPFYHEVSGTIKHAQDAQRDKIQKQADSDRATFQRQWGFAVGSPEYYNAFSKPRENRYVIHGRID